MVIFLLSKKTIKALVFAADDGAHIGVEDLKDPFKHRNDLIGEIVFHIYLFNVGFFSKLCAITYPLGCSFRDDI